MHHKLTVVYHLKKLNEIEEHRGTDLTPFVYIQKCCHLKTSLYRIPHSRLPMEVILDIRMRITDASTLRAFDRAFHIPRCPSLFCHRYACEYYFEQHLDTLSIGEVEYNKRDLFNNENALYSLHVPSCYQIERTNNGFSILHIKPFQRQFVTSLRDPITQDTNWIPVNLYHVYDMHLMKHDLKIKHLLPKECVSKYHAIKKWFKQPSYTKCKSPYFIPANSTVPRTQVQRWSHVCREWPLSQGKVWIYCDMNLEADKDQPHPDWVQTLYDIRDFQRKHSSVLQKGLSHVCC